MKKTGWSKAAGPVYKAAAPKRVDMALLKSYDWDEKTQTLRLDLKAPLPLAKLPAIKVPARYWTRLACYSSGKGVRYAGKPVPAAGIEARSAESFAEVKRMYSAAHKAYMSKWGNRMAKSFKADSKMYEQKMLRKAMSLIMFRKGRPVWLCLLSPYRLADGKMLDLVAWHNEMVPLSAAERRSIHHLAYTWLAKKSKYRLGVGLDGFDKESVKFFSGLGFRVSRLRFELAD